MKKIKPWKFTDCELPFSYASDLCTLPIVNRNHASDGKYADKGGIEK